ncbi:UNVERIFIED_CONTAM: hypothetical protein Sradi_4161600 [Sesamum radiatum]|uniref:Uncharacterized protein n=1 Tax=Sesamum radiatum TaxID=300843 RepID=A0AAW2P5D2_SESRA
MTLFSSEGGAKYFDPQEVRKRIHKGDFVSWTSNMIAKDKDCSFVDDGHAKEFKEDYFMVVRSNYLPLRQGDHFVVELYNSHQFSCQFGFFQEVLGTFAKRLSKIKFIIVHMHLIKDHEECMVSFNTPKCKEVLFRGIKKMVGQTHGGFFEENAARLLGARPIKAPPKYKERAKRVQDLPSKRVASVPPKILKLSRLLRQARRKAFLVLWRRMRVVILTVIRRGQRGILISQNQWMLMVKP